MGDDEAKAGHKQAKNLKLILCGDSAVGKSKLVERFMLNDFCPKPESTHGVEMYSYEVDLEGRKVMVDFWDTAGQERFNNVHDTYYLEAHTAILVFDVQRKPTYKNLDMWLSELRRMRPDIPVMVAANKIDLDMEVTKKVFNFSKKHDMKLYYVSAATGMNVVQMFNHAIKNGLEYLEDANKNDFMQQVHDLINDENLGASLEAPASTDPPPAKPAQDPTPT